MTLIPPIMPRNTILPRLRAPDGASDLVLQYIIDNKFTIPSFYNSGNISIPQVQDPGRALRFGPIICLQ